MLNGSENKDVIEGKKFSKAIENKQLNSKFFFPIY